MTSFRHHPSEPGMSADYRQMAAQLRTLIAEEQDLIANAANMSALLIHALPLINWAGFYLHHADALVLGPFQGMPACVRITPGKGVCGTAFTERRTIIVSDVEEYPGHISCDPASRAEIVIPLLKGDRCLGVLDLDSPVRARFDAVDAAGLEDLAGILVNLSDVG